MTLIVTLPRRLTLGRGLRITTGQEYGLNLKALRRRQLPLGHSFGVRPARMSANAVRASFRFATSTNGKSGLALATASAQFAWGVRKNTAPADFAATSFWGTPPMGPT